QGSRTGRCGWITSFLELDRLVCYELWSWDTAPTYLPVFSFIQLLKLLRVTRQLHLRFSTGEAHVL
ncbi:hypothetical protein K3G63_22660, partial [Hymenobacter sp. HSC-4F20]|uniref:hypothetical protein n=1 Tax=Hymenobacter sp. HSC-4F20 TaxID=2864135 RepID=UPI001C73CAB4